jgi:hypothetical protein
MHDEIKAEMRRERKKAEHRKEQVSPDISLLTKSIEKLVKITREQSDEITQLKERIANLESNQNEIKHNVYADSDLNVFMVDESKKSAIDTMITKKEIDRGHEKYKKSKK